MALALVPGTAAGTNACTSRRINLPTHCCVHALQHPRVHASTCRHVHASKRRRIHVSTCQPQPFEKSERRWMSQDSCEPDPESNKSRDNQLNSLKNCIYNCWTFSQHGIQRLSSSLSFAAAAIAARWGSSRHPQAVAPGQWHPLQEYFKNSWIHLKKS